MDSLKTLEPYVDSVIEYFLEHLKKYDGHAMNLGDQLQLFAIGKNTSNVITKAQKLT